MRICVTCASNSPEIDSIYQYCLANDLVMRSGAYIHADHSYWIWHIEAEPSTAITWLLLKYPADLCIY